MPTPVRGIGVDVGGTKIAAGVVDEHGEVLTRSRVESPATDADRIVAAIIDAVEQLGGVRDGVAVGVGAAGLVDLDGVVHYAPNLAWRGVPLRALLEDALGVPVSVDNDGNAAAWAEFSAGAAAGARDSAVMVTLGTGVGGGLVLSGALQRGAHGLGAELGHLIVQEGGRRCGCGNLGCLEAYASGTAIGRIAEDARTAGEVPSGSPLDRATLTGADVGRAAAAGDPSARAVLATCGTWLGVGLASISNALDPEVIVIGGGAAAAGQPLLGPARDALTARLMGAGYRPPPRVVTAAFGADAGLIGAALLAAVPTASQE